jgi:hypothetical protein
MSKLKTPLILFFITGIVIALLALSGPEEKSLGANVRLVYLHGAWVLTAEVAFVVAALAGLIGFISRRDLFHQWSAALGRTGIFFWLTYLPLSLWAMESNWNGLFLSEPRFRLAVIFAVTGVLLQIGLWMIHSTKHYASTAVADFQLRQLCHHWFLCRVEFVDMAGCLFPY